MAKRCMQRRCWGVLSGKDVAMCVKGIYVGGLPVAAW